VAVHAFAAARRAAAAARLLLTAGSPAVQQSIEISAVAGHTAANQHRPDGTDG